MQSLSPLSRHICWATYHSGRSNIPSIGGLMMRSADVAIALPPLGRLHQFGSADLKVLLQFGGTDGSPMVPNQDYRLHGDGSPSAKCSRVHCGASNEWRGVIVQQQHCLWQQSRSVAPNSLRTSGYCALIPTGRKHQFTTKALALWSTAMIMSQQIRRLRGKTDYIPVYI
jgi:hypothetical protein